MLRYRNIKLRIIISLAILLALVAAPVLLAHARGITLQQIVKKRRITHSTPQGAFSVDPDQIAAALTTYSHVEDDSHYIDVDVRTDDVVKVVFSGNFRGKCFMKIYFDMAASSTWADEIAVSGGYVGFPGGDGSPEIPMHKMEWRPYYLVGFWRAGHNGTLRFRLTFGNYPDPSTGDSFYYTQTPPPLLPPHDIELHFDSRIAIAEIVRLQ